MSTEPDLPVAPLPPAEQLKEIGATFRRLRRSMGLTQRQVAERGGTSVTTVYRTERGVGRVTLFSMVRVADGMGCDLRFEFRQTQIGEAMQMAHVD